MDIGRRRFLAALPAIGALTPRRLSAQAAGGSDPLGVRADFPAVVEQLYLDSAYIAPTPLPVVDAGRMFAESKGRQPIALGDMVARTDQVRAAFARLVGAETAEIGFLFATSEGENIVASARGLTRGDNVVVDELHYNTTFVLYRHLEQTRGVELRIVKARAGGVSVSDFAPHVDRRTKLISVAWVSHQNGFRHEMAPLAELAHRHGAWLYADAVQAVGMFPIDVRAAGVDVMTAGTYKWLLGSYGVAPFYVRGEILDQIPPDRMGALHVERTLPDHRYEIYKTAKKFDYATLAFGPVYQLGAALEYLDRVGVARIERHTVGLANQLAGGLRARGLDVLTPVNNQSSIVAFRNPANAATTRAILVVHGAGSAFARTGHRSGCRRRCSTRSMTCSDFSTSPANWRSHPEQPLGGDVRAVQPTPIPSVGPGTRVTGAASAKSVRYAPTHVFGAANLEPMNPRRSRRPMQFNHKQGVLAGRSSLARRAEP